jgi:hypothetical protein
MRQDLGMVETELQVDAQVRNMLWHAPPHTKSTYVHCECDRELSCIAEPFLTLRLNEKDPGN